MKEGGLSTISFALQKEGGQKDAVSIPNATKNYKSARFNTFKHKKIHHKITPSL